MATPVTNPVATVPVVSAWYSKINWTQAGAAATALIVAFGVDLPADQKTSVLGGLVVAQSLLTWVFRTWFNGSVNPGSIS